MAVIYMGKIYPSYKAAFSELPPLDEDDFACERCGTFEYQSRRSPILCASCSEAVTPVTDEELELDKKE